MALVFYSRRQARVARSSSHSIRRFFALVAKVFDVLDPLLSLSNRRLGEVGLGRIINIIDGVIMLTLHVIMLIVNH